MLEVCSIHQYKLTNKSSTHRFSGSTT